VIKITNLVIPAGKIAGRSNGDISYGPAASCGTQQICVVVTVDEALTSDTSRGILYS